MEEEQPVEIIVPAESVKEETPKTNWVNAIAVILILLVLMGTAFYIDRYYIPKQCSRECAQIRNISFQNGTILGYQQCMWDVAYTAVTEGQVSYVIPTTNLTVVLVQKVYNETN